MTPHIRISLAGFSALALLAHAGGSWAADTVVTFDGIAGQSLTSSGSIPNGYEGLSFSAVGWIGKNKHPVSGYFNGIGSGNYAAYNENGALASISPQSGTFNVRSVLVTGAWNNGLEVTFTGYRSGSVAFTKQVTVNTTGPTLVNLGFGRIDSLRFVGTGGTDAGYSGGGDHVVLDNLTLYTSADTSMVAPSGKPVMGALDSYAGSDPKLSNLQLAVASQDAETVARAAEQLRPSLNGAQARGAQMAMTQVLGVLAARADSIRLAKSGESGVGTGEAMRGLSFWMQGFGFRGDQGKLGGIDGYGATTGGLAAGGDTRIGDDVRVGASFAWADTRIEDKGANTGNSTRIQSYQGNLYANYTGSPWYVNGTLGAGLHDYRTTRRIAFTGFSDVAHGSFQGWQYTAKLDGGYPLSIGDYVATPVAGAVYSLLRRASYVETSQNGAALAVASQDTTSMKSILGAKLARTFDIDDYRIAPEFRASWQHEFDNRAQQTTASFAAGGAAFTNAGMKVSPDSAVIGVGIGIAGSGIASVVLNYDSELRTRYVGHTGMLKVQLEF